MNESIGYRPPHLNDLKKIPSSLIEKIDEIPSIFIKLLDGRTITVPFEPAAEIGQYIKLIEQREGIPFSEQRLLFGGKQLKVEKLLSDYGIYPNSTMHLVSNLIGGMQIFIQQNLDDNVITLEVEPNESIENIKQKIEHLTGLYRYSKKDENGGNECALELTFNDEILESDRILSHYKIKENSTLYGNYSFCGWASCPTLTFQFSEFVEEEFFSVDNPSDNIQPGLNLMGECSSLMCNYATIWVPKGFGAFNMNKEIKLLHHCSNCRKTAIKVINFGFYQCFFSIEGKYKEDFNPIEFQKEEQRAPDDRLITYTGTNKREWYYLNVSTKWIQNKRNESDSGVPGMSNYLANSPWINDIPFLPESGGKAPFPEALSALESNNEFLTHQSDSEQKSIAGSVILIGVLFTAAISYLLYSKYKK